MVHMIPSFLHSSNHSHDLEKESSFVLSRTSVYGSVQFASVELASVEAQISLIKLEFSSCLFADSLMNLLRVTSIDFLRS
ncbi:hypothetical protein Tco_0204148 [Tanacetum coccineum]